jgi:hypothetical protein
MKFSAFFIICILSKLFFSSNTNVYLRYSNKQVDDFFFSFYLIKSIEQNPNSINLMRCSSYCSLKSACISFTFSKKVATNVCNLYKEIPSLKLETSYSNYSDLYIKPSRLYLLNFLFNKIIKLFKIFFFFK